jgi:TM2 domain-containing membrane protein YozV
MSEIQQAPIKGVGEKYCKDCGAVINEKAEICPKCGVRQQFASGSLGSVAPNGKSKTTAAILAFLLGGLGIHKFYLGKTGQGILYLLFFWTFIPAILALIEFVMFLTMSDEVFAEKYGGA